MMVELFDAVASWHSLLLVVGTFGFFPGFILRLAVKIYPPDDPRRAEIIADLYTTRRIERLFYVAEQLETVIVEGVGARFSRLLRTRSKRRRISQQKQFIRRVQNLSADVYFDRLPALLEEYEFSFHFVPMHGTVEPSPDSTAWAGVAQAESRPFVAIELPSTIASQLPLTGGAAQTIHFRCQCRDN